MVVRSDEFNQDNLARPSSLRAVQRRQSPDPHHDLQLFRELEAINTRTLKELGPSLPGGMTGESKRKPNIRKWSALVGRPSKEKEKMRLQHAAMLAIASVASGGSAELNARIGSSLEVSSTSQTHSFEQAVDPRYIQPRIQNGKLIMPFFDHSFSSFCFDTIKCRVLYHNRYDAINDEPTGSLTEGIRKSLGAHWILFDLPSVTRVTWTSKDGAAHDETIDLGKIFRSRLVRYASDLDVHDVDLDVYYGGPEVILVVEDRSIHVYMKARIVLRHSADPSNRQANTRNDLVVAYTHKF